jgi:RNA-directed DNA polymerase
MSRNEQEYIHRLVQKFGEPEDPTDLSHPVSYASNLIDRGYPVLFDLRHLAHVTGGSTTVLGLILRDPSAFYSRFIIRKRRGGSREIDAPTPELKRVQQWINRFIAQHLPMHEAAHGFRAGRSIETNARAHAGAESILAMDIRDFFGSVPRSAVLRLFTQAGYSRSVATLLTRFVTLDGRLPQGAPTSPALANSVARRLDRRLAALAERRGAIYSRYADDLAFSGSTGAIHGARFKRAIEAILRDSGFPPQQDKTHYMDGSTRQQVAGLVVNVRPNAPRERRRWIRQELHYLEKFGEASHLAKRGVGHSHYREFIYGHVFALFVSNPSEARGYLRRLDRMTWD